jgi:hypothetical protein
MDVEVGRTDAHAHALWVKAEADGPTGHGLFLEWAFVPSISGWTACLDARLACCLALSLDLDAHPIDIG